MKKLLLSILLLALAIPTLAQTRKPMTPRLSVASRNFDVTAYGAVGDGQVALDCSMTNGAAVLTCTASHFFAEDVGKVIAVYGAGMLRNGFRQPLAATITAYNSGTSVTLSANAQADVTNSERTVWGTNNTAAIQAAVDAAGDAGGGLVEFPSGHYLTEGVKLPCSTVGNTAYGNCPRAHNNITLKGNTALNTIVENWNPDTLWDGVVDLGKIAEIPGLGGYNWPNGRLRNIEIAGLTLRQVKYATRANIKIITSYATEDVSIHDNYLYSNSYEGIYMGGGFKSWRWRVFNNVAYEVGKGGPGYQNTLSAYNLNGSYVEAFGNKASNCGQCFESGSRHAFFYQNLCENSTHSFLIGSTGSGVWDVTISDNVLKNNYYALVAGNGNGTFHDLRFTGNTMIDTPDVNITYGANVNTVVEVETDTIIHGQSVVSGNRFILTNPALANRSVFRFFVNPTFAYGADSLLVTDNTVSYSFLPTNAVLNVGGQGGQKWEPGKAFSVNQPATSSLWSGYWYKAQNAGTTGATEPIWPQGQGQTVTDGTIVWLCMGARPQIVVNNLSVTVPTNIPDSGSLYGTWPGAVRIDYGSPGLLKTNNIQINNIRWRRQAVGGFHEDIVPIDAPFSDTRRYTSYADDVPVTDYWQFGTYLQKRAIAADGTYGWFCIRDGYRAPTYSATASYSTFGTLVLPTTDTGKVYQLIAGSCTATPEPVWPTASGATVTNGGCTWKVAGVAAKFTVLK